MIFLPSFLRCRGAFLLALIPFLTLSVRAQQTFSNFQAASVVVGQTDFTSQDTTASPSVTPGPSEVALGPAGQMAVSDQSVGRVLIWNTVPTTNGVPADLVIGKPDFVTTSSGVTSSLMSSCEGVVFTSDGKLIVCDYGNNRVLIWNTVPTSSGQAANVVIGQSDFVSNGAGVAADKMAGPRGVLVTPSGQLIVTDYNNNRVLIFNSIPTTSGASADLVIGQGTLGTATFGSGADQMFSPVGCALASDGKLLIADSSNNRVLIFNSVPTANDASADLVIGQTAFGSGGSGTTSSTFINPIGVALSPTGQLSVSDFGNNRVLIFNSVPTADGAAADVVLGQPDFVSNTAFNGGTTASSMQSAFPSAFTADGRLLVPGRDMSRVMIFGTPAVVPSVTTLAATAVVPTGGLLNSSVNPNGFSTDVHFDYSTDPGLAGATSTSTQNIGNGPSAVSVNAALTGLAPKTTYYFRVIATNVAGTTTGSILSFYTGVLGWDSGNGASASGGTLDASLIPTTGTQTFTDVNGQSFYVVVTTSNLNADGTASYFGDPGWWFEGGGPSSGYGSVTFQFFNSLNNQPYAVSGIDLRLLDAEVNERFRDFGYWDANNNFVSVGYGTGLLTFSNTPIYHATDNSYENNAAAEPGDQEGKWIELNLSNIAVTGFTLEAHRQTASAGSVIMGDIISPWAAWRTQYFGPAPFPASADDFADPDGDGVTNVLEYFYGTDPTVPDSPNPLQMTLVANRVTLTFPRNTAATDTTATVQGADAAGGPWTDLARSVNGAPFTALVAGVPVSESGSGAIVSVTVGDEFLITDPGHAMRYLRLQVVH
ncbi:NHL repeat containing protein [Chthoniobacter flavus Ellin428]|uniref:NHL repeat containing protein n=2 Tax=Chthoniobacter flavus TaxID=191863 RepID=B4CY63_9BACT|nr:NHL repeat-containing protein [Chthoniobacter flavus]EDY21211.1 NHL repeat containing protein [Chthoniobacter flavus Ellin428]